MSSERPDLIRSAGLRSTAPRRAVLACVQAAGVPLSHNEVVERLPEWDRATIFRNLVALTEAGLLRRVDIGDHIWRFETLGEAHSAAGHAHFTCTDCGVVACVDGVVISLPPGADLPGQAMEIQLRGRCEGCVG
jgi:Fur family ferric uptake transcriptional regulator